jgi:tetratricopeptide (TPR) repeat protein
VPDEPTSAPLDPNAFDAWAREAADSWQRTRVFDEVARRWADPEASADQRALAAVWGAPGGLASIDDLTALVDDPAVDDVLRARLRATLAVSTVDADPDGAMALALAAVEGSAGAPIRTRLGIWLTAGEVHQRANRPDVAMRLLGDAGEAVKNDPDAPAWAFVAIDAERLGIAAPRSQNRAQFAASVEKVADAARALPPTPTVVDVLVKLGTLLSALGAAPRAEIYMEAVLAATVDVPEARAARFRALLVLADARFAVGEGDAAREAQREAIATIEPLGASPMLGWARRGLAVQLRADDRHAESVEEFEAAAEAYFEIGAPADAAMLRVEAAAALLQASDSEAAHSRVNDVLESLDDLADEQRIGVEVRANEVLAQVATTEGDLETAAEHWLEVADLASRIELSPLDAILAAAQLFAADGDLDESTAQFFRAELAAADERDPARASARVMRIRAETLRDAGHPEEAAEMARIAANHARAGGDEAQAVYLAVIAADSMHAAGDSAAAVQLYTETLAGEHIAAMPALQGAVHAGFAKLLHDLGRHAEAEVHDAEAARLGVGDGS